MMRRLIPNPRGAATVEFALLAPAFFAFIFLIIEGGRIVWTQQVLQETAVASVRCLVLGSTGCANANQVKSWAVTHAGRSGVTLATTAITPASNITCNGRSGMNRVVITAPYSSAVGAILPAAHASLSATACFPTV